MGRNVTSWVPYSRLLVVLGAAPGNAPSAPSRRFSGDEPPDWRESATPEHSLLVALSVTCYTRGARAVAERNATRERRPQKIISLGTFHEWPEAVRASFLARGGLRPGRGALTRRAVWLDMAESTSSILIRN